jgi:hypothetical protein
MMQGTIASYTPVGSLDRGQRPSVRGTCGVIALALNVNLFGLP